MLFNMYEYAKAEFQVVMLCAVLCVTQRERRFEDGAVFSQRKKGRTKRQEHFITSITVFRKCTNYNLFADVNELKLVIRTVLYCTVPADYCNFSHFALLQATYIYVRPKQPNQIISIAISA
jgi:hypothetical protein